jgi:hypothetical protein
MPRLEMQIHQIKGNPRLQIPLNLVDRHLLPYIQDAAERDPGLHDGLIHLFVRLDAALEIIHGLFLAHACIVRVAGSGLEGDIGSDDLGVVAERFEEEELEVGLFGDAFTYPLAPLECRVGRV